METPKTTDNPIRTFIFEHPLGRWLILYPLIALFSLGALLLIWGLLVAPAFL